MSAIQRQRQSSPLDMGSILHVRGGPEAPSAAPRESKPGERRFPLGMGSFARFWQTPRTRHPAVVPAKAGTHTRRPLEYGPRLSPGRHAVKQHRSTATPAGHGVHREFAGWTAEGFKLADAQGYFARIEVAGASDASASIRVHLRLMDLLR